MSSEGVGVMSKENDEKSALVPRLRFPEFDGIVSALPLAAVADFVSEKISVDQITSAQYVSTENLLPDFGGMNSAAKLPSVSSVTSFKPNDVLVSNIRPYLRKVWQANICGGASNDVLVVRSTERIAADYLAAILRSDLFIDYVMRGAKGVKMPRGEISMIEEFPVPCPSAEEQQKIADCLSSLDELITAETQKLDALKTHKKGLMQQLFPREGETVPRLRFPEFRDAEEWEDKLLGEISSVVASGDLDATYFSPVKTNEHIYPVYSNAVEKQGLYGYYSLPKYSRDSITITARGTLGVAFARSHEFMGIGRLLVVSNFKNIDSGFICECWNHLGKVPTEVTSIPQFTAVAAKSTTLPIPAIEEQQKIADCLSSIDELIAVQSQKIDALKTHKKGLMQQLFPELNEVPV